MQASTQYPVVTAVLNIIADWWKRHRERSSLLDLPSADLERVAKDLGVSAADLRELDRSCAVLLLPKMLQALNLDASAIARLEPDVYRDLQRVCTVCDQKKRCASELAEGDAAASYEGFCPNALTLRAVAEG
jgi:uncharacterized protein YjiS (DUF1127 family)